MYLQLADYFALFGYFSVVIGIGFWVILFNVLPIVLDKSFINSF